MNSLPVLKLRENIITAAKTCNRLIIKAPTGSGKSTQIPQMLLDSGILKGKILVLQPRRIAARMLANRVATERGSVIGQEIGFQTRFESMTSESTRVQFITEGILPRLLLSDKMLSSVSAVVFDEFHERSLTVDLGLALIKDLQQHRADLKVVVMSATLSSSPLADYLEGAEIIVSEGRTFPVSVHYYSEVAKEDPWVAAKEAVKYLINQGCSGDFLIFMPGAYEIRRTAQLLRESSFGEPLQIMMLYGDLPGESQRQVMEPAKKRKIIIATNIAETSLTIPGVRHVIDSGLARVNRYDQGRGFNTLYVEKISIDSADQRAGRAGREAPGTCIRLWSIADQRGRAQRTQPEIGRVDLSEVILQLKMLGYTDIQKFNWFEAPESNSIRVAQELLRSIGAIDSEGNLKTDGKLMAELPMHPRLARLLIEASKRGVPKQGAMAAAVLSERPFFSGSAEVSREIIKNCAGSDFELIRYVISRITESNFDPSVCRKFNVNISALNQVIRTQAFYLQVCRKRGMHTRDVSDDPKLLSQAILIAYSDRLACRRDQGTLLCDLADGRRGELEKDSVARGAKLMVATTIREIKSKQQVTPRTVLSLVCGVDEEWLHQYFLGQWKTDTELVWNSIRQTVESRELIRCCGVVIKESIDIHPDPQKAGDVLATIIIDKKLILNGWGTEVQDYIHRVQWLAQLFPEKNLPLFTDEDKALVIHELCRNEFRYDAVREKPAIGYVKELLSWEQQRIVEDMAPQYVLNPTGKKLRITYRSGQTPVVRARIQEIFDLRKTPSIANETVAVVMEILAPNMRPVQVTDNLERFWSVHYPELKKMLSRRYPKHEWR